MRSPDMFGPEATPQATATPLEGWSPSSVGGRELVAEPGGRTPVAVACRAQSTCGELGSAVDEMVCATTPFFGVRITVGRGPGAGAG